MGLLLSVMDVTYVTSSIITETERKRNLIANAAVIIQNIQSIRANSSSSFFNLSFLDHFILKEVFLLFTQEKNTRIPDNQILAVNGMETSNRYKVHRNIFCLFILILFDCCLFLFYFCICCIVILSYFVLYS